MNCDACENGLKVAPSMHGLDCPKRRKSAKPAAAAPADAKTITLYVVDIAPFPGAEARVRTWEYTQTKSTLTAVEANDEKSAPHGLRRIPLKKLPAVGGLFGLAVAALTKEEAVATLTKVAEKELKKAQERAAVLLSGIEGLKRL